MSRVMFFIDGFNVYHSIKGNASYHRFLWINYRALAERFMRDNDTLTAVYYFTAFASWLPESMKRHRLLVDANRSQGVNVVFGKFKEKDHTCRQCSACYKIREEKQTDVNIATYLLKEAFMNRYDTGVLVSNDTDIIPALRAVKEAFPQKRLGILFPIDRWSGELKEASDFWRKIERKDLAKSQFPDDVTLPSGVTLSRPASWR
jgi:uncharacterized LabA/DUF88 family protein